MCFEYYESSIKNCIDLHDTEGVYELINKASNDKDISNKEFNELYEIAKFTLENTSL